MCKHGTMKAGLTTVTLERDGTNIVIHKVPADVCESWRSQSAIWFQLANVRVTTFDQ